MTRFSELVYLHKLIVLSYSHSISVKFFYLFQVFLAALKLNALLFPIQSESKRAIDFMAEIVSVSTCECHSEIIVALFNLQWPQLDCPNECGIR